MPFRLPGNLNGSMAYKKLRHLELEIFCQESYLDEWEFGRSLNPEILERH